MFGQVVTIDHIDIMSPEAASVEDHANVFTFKDLASGLAECEPFVHKNEEDTTSALQPMHGQKEVIGFVHGDGSDEIPLACNALGSGWRRPADQMNGVIEWSNRLVLEGARMLLTHAGLDKRWWSRVV